MGIFYGIILAFWGISKWIKMIFWGFFALQTWIFSMSNVFTWNGFDESVLYHLQTWIEWAWVGSDKKIVFLWIFLWIFLIIYIIFCVKNRKYIFKKYQKTMIFFLALWCFFHPLSFNFFQLFFWHVAISQEISQDFSSYYVNDEIVWEGNGKNLVYLYLESFENTYLDENIFPWLAPNLQKISEKSTQVLWMKQTFWTQWTIAGIVASQCGLPLTVSAEKSGNLYPKVTCLWDILHEKNYQTVYLGWADEAFAGKWNFLKNHWFQEVIGKNDFIQSGISQKNMYDWGLYDDVFFEEFEKKYFDLSAQNKKFFLAWLTLDTHWEFWVLSEKCKNLPYNAELWILKSYHCTDYLIGEFFKNISQSPEFENTLFVITSDHYAMNHNESSSILQNHQEKREHLFLMYEPWKNPQTLTKPSTSFDKFPTVLEALWFDTEKAGLGVSLFSSQKTLQEIFGDAKNILTSWRNEYLKY